MSDEVRPVCCDFCYNSNVPLYEGGFEPLIRICAFCASKAVAEITPQPTPEPAPTPEPPSKEERLAFIGTERAKETHPERLKGTHFLL
jgi:hypothetical protein